MVDPAICNFIHDEGFPNVSVELTLAIHLLDAHIGHIPCEVSGIAGTRPGP